MKTSCTNTFFIPCCPWYAYHDYYLSRNIEPGIPFVVYTICCETSILNGIIVHLWKRWPIWLLFDSNARPRSDGRRFGRLVHAPLRVVITYVQGAKRQQRFRTCIGIIHYVFNRNVPVLCPLSIKNYCHRPRTTAVVMAPGPSRNNRSRSEKATWKSTVEQYIDSFTRVRSNVVSRRCSGKVDRIEYIIN